MVLEALGLCIVVFVIIAVIAIWHSIDKERPR